MFRALAFLAACAAFGQSPAGLPQFEVASVKVSPPDPTPPMGRPLMNRVRSFEGGPGTDDPGQIVCTSCDLSWLIATAYEVSSSQVSPRGIPFRDTYDIVAKLPRGSTRHDLHLMLQQLLAERFHLTLHREKHLSDVYALVLGKNEPLLGPAGDELPGPVPYPTLSGNRLFKMTGQHKSVKQLADAMSMFTDEPVVDLTGLKGGYDFTLYWLASVRLDHPKKRDWPPGMKKLALRVEDAATQQLGLRLVSRKMPADLLVVDSISSTPVPD